MDALIARFLLAAAVLASPPAAAQTIFWSSPPNAVNQTSSGQPMDAGFRFELGVFAATFVPNSGNLAQWSANWRPIQRVAYNTGNKRYAADHTPENNDSPFSIDKAVYVWGFSGEANMGEWILFRANSWLFPDANPLIPPPPNSNEWFANATGVTAVLGTVNSGGSPFLMRSASVAGVLPPTTTWDQWRAEKLAGELLDGENDDPDKDGMCNLMECVFGFDPLKPGSLPAMPLTLANVGGQNHLQLRVPRRKDHLLALSVQVSSNLVQWNQGGSYVQIVEDGLEALVVRDLSPYPPVGGKRFMRLAASPMP